MTVFPRFLVASCVRVRWILAVCLVLYLQTGSIANAASTWLCNATNEPLYVSVRHYAASLFVQNARTEGWKKLPTRGVLRSCWIVNRTARDHIVVVGVLRDSEIVPIKLTPRRHSRTRRVDVCVPKSARSFEYRSDARSDSSCGNGYQLARASFSVEGGDNEVDIDLAGRIDVPQRTPKSQGSTSTGQNLLLTCGDRTVYVKDGNAIGYSNKYSDSVRSCGKRIGPDNSMAKMGSDVVCQSTKDKVAIRWDRWSMAYKNCIQVNDGVTSQYWLLVVDKNTGSFKLEEADWPAYLENLFEKGTCLEKRYKSETANGQCKVEAWDGI